MRAERWRVLAATALALWLILPLVPLAIWSFAHGWRFPALLPQAWSLKAWRQTFDPASGILPSLGVTAFIALATTVVALMVAVPAARALGLYRFPGRGLVLTLVLAPAILPGISVALGLHGVFLRLGLSGTLAGVILAHLIPVLPYALLILTAVFARFDTTIEDQARSLGATRWQVQRYVTLPAILPGLVTAALFSFLVSWSQYLLTLAIGGGRVQTLPLTLYSYAASGRNDLTGAIALVYILPGLVILALTARHVTGRSIAHGTGP